MEPKERIEYYPEGINFDGVNDYIEIPKINHLGGQLRFFCCPIDFHNILHILKALVKNRGRAVVCIIKPTSQKWRGMR